MQPDHLMTPEEVCAKHNLNNISVDYTDDNFRMWTSYKLFADNVRPLLCKENPKVSMTKLVQLVSAKWREFLSLNPYREQISGSDKSAKKASKEGEAIFIHNVFDSTG
jgi:hypothetical protein